LSTEKIGTHLKSVKSLAQTERGLAHLCE